MEDTMFILFGFGKPTVQYLGSAGIRLCPRCRNQKEWSHLRMRTWFTLFFIPIIPYKTRNVSVCPVCAYEVES
jgi:hypothetical protein